MAKRVSAPRAAGSNVTPDTYQMHSRIVRKAKGRMEELRDQWREAQAEYREKLKAAGQDGINLKSFKEALGIVDGDPDQSDIDLRDLIQYREWEQIPVKREIIAEQLALNLQPSDESAADHAEFKAFDDGLKAGKNGYSMTTCPYNEGTKDYVDWTTGWKEGQKALLVNPKKAAKTKATQPKPGTRATSKAKAPKDDKVVQLHGDGEPPTTTH